MINLKFLKITRKMKIIYFFKILDNVAPTHHITLFCLKYLLFLFNVFYNFQVTYNVVFFWLILKHDLFVYLGIEEPNRRKKSKSQRNGKSR